ncbi:non-functional NADPH-dependent codeinone reductase 2-like [Durio zibethinus]|uniref:Non-functional NADPH-dependent codeinone reductase 2-like n=1 Tax=Durio zibethinus TaxID=66656 RepID=A0A6P6BHF7_DURZI|nr:non-functional NADPH-dependent codeinone reductase 2-like [Durio zibethinus]
MVDLEVRAKMQETNHPEFSNVSDQSIPTFPPVSADQKGIPRLGLGTASEGPLGASVEIVKEAILQAIKHGYRHFDTAPIYQTEKLLGEAISDALRLGLIKSRDELFITSKLWCSDAHHDRVLPALQKTLNNLKLEYLDLYLIHWPVSVRSGDQYELPIKKEDIVPIDPKSVWEAMEQCEELGLTKSIGVSNFSCKKLQTILSTAKIPPVVNQVEMNPMWQQKKLRKFCEEKGIRIMAYSPLGAANRVMECELLKEIAQAKGKSIAQVCLRWAYEEGVCVLVKSFNKERMKENLDIFNWKLSREESHKISLLPQRKGFTGEGFISDDGPYKSLEQLWDGEI